MCLSAPWCPMLNSSSAEANPLARLDTSDARIRSPGEYTTLYIPPSKKYTYFIITPKMPIPTTKSTSHTPRPHIAIEHVPLSNVHITFQPLDHTPGLLPLPLARSNPSIKYRALSLLFRPTQKSESTSNSEETISEIIESYQTTPQLVPLDVANKSKRIKYRPEGFELKHLGECF